MEKVIIGADASGFDLKEVIREYLEKKGYEIIDIGMYSMDKDIQIGRASCRERV